jgi:hypothetical protein
MTREDINQQALQVASFRSKEGALKFVEILQSDSKIHSAEVGSPRLRSFLLIEQVGHSIVSPSM